jgi:transposase
VDKQSLESLLHRGESVERIAKRFGKDPSTVSYWMKKHGLSSPYAEKHAAKGGLERDTLEELVAAGFSSTGIAESVRRSPATVRHWLATYGLETTSTVQRRITRDARSKGKLIVQRVCRHHGLTDFWLEGRGAYRCLRCRRNAVVRRRRKVKENLVADAGGACAICGYSRYSGALQFHHLEPTEKLFTLSADGVSRSIERARREAKKCALLCANCHAEVENDRAQVPLQLARDRPEWDHPR